MAFDTYSGLKTSVAAWLARDDLTSLIPDFILLCHKQLMRDLRGHLRLQKRASLTLSGDYVQVPDDFLEAVSMRVDVDGESPMQFSPDDLTNAFGNETGIPSKYSVVSGANIENFHFNRTPTGQTATLEYYAKLPFFQTDGATNWILTDYPDVYLNGSLFHGYVYLRDANSAQGVKALYDYSLAALMAAGRRARWGGNGMAARAA